MISSTTEPMKIPCPVCRKRVEYQGNPHRPFCSARCRTIDLGEWATESYVVSGKSSEVEEENVSTSSQQE